MRNLWILGGVGSISIAGSLWLLYVKYRVVFTGEKCKGTIVGIADQNAGFTIRGFKVIKHAFIVKIKNRTYRTAHGSLFPALGKRQIGKEIHVFKNEKYGKEVFKCLDFRIEIVAFLMILFGVFLILLGLR